MTSTDRTEQNLDKAISHTESEISRTDGKASALLTLNGLLVAALSLVGTDVHGVSLAFAVTGALALVAAVVLTLMVVQPRLKAPGGNHDRSSFVYWATATPEDIAAGLKEDRRLARVQVLSRIALRKMRGLRHAGFASLTAVITIAAAVLTR
ncbi:DUF5706 domain-containing protein [Kribbella solani]|uniref:DUF5706 domain-containing protein n=1 Tax=Streptomyces acidiscabies TaxID=42234 RepID=A0ABU4MGB0_9ACTN|nr:MULTISPECIES: Pycsar system effector family protein [Actinomycetes]MDX2973819.1 DUF5706 domain-containing protein [Kribbella solani]MDX3007080.1 DUF5706 domain-containing protein [Kribbella solani]MDX3026145.1 DUF5706 domain-containing protein [Streptomyces acidiscabies]